MGNAAENKSIGSRGLTNHCAILKGPYHEKKEFTDRN